MTKVVIDQHERFRAVDARYSYIVQAPAGSGKTELLTDRILSLLAVVERPEDILAITFTRKAAAEMRERLVRKLVQGQGNEPEEAHKKASWEKAQRVLERDRQFAWNLLDNPNRLRIQTIDSFCQSLVRMTPSLSGAGANLSPTESDAEFFNQAAQRVLNLLDKEPCVAHVLKHLDVKVSKMQELLVLMINKRQSWLHLVQNPTVTLSQMVKTLYGIIEQTLKEAEAALNKNGNWFDEIKAIVCEAATVLEEAEKENPFKEWLTWNGTYLKKSVDDILLWKGLVHLLLTKEGGLRKTITVSSGVPPKSPYKKPFLAWLGGLQNPEAIEEALIAVRDLPEKLFREGQAPLFENFFQCLSLCEQALQAIFREREEVDFTEIMQRALQALGDDNNPSDILLKIDTDLKHILIDEFQDTNFEQKKLLERITSGWYRGDGRTLFLVGDPMQSIYRFRNAEVSLFLDLAEKAKRNNKALSEEDKEGVLGDVVMDFLQLQVNFRSDEGVVNWVNEVFSTVFPQEDDLSLGGIRYSPSYAFNEETTQVAVKYYPFLYGTQANSQELNEQEAQLVVNKKHQEKAEREMAQQQAIERAIEIVRNALDKHPHSDNAVAILVRSRSHIEGLAEALVANGIAVQAVKMVPLASTEEVTDLVQLIRALTHRNDRLAWMSLLRSPFCGMTLSSLTHLFENKVNTSIPLQITQYLMKEEDLTALIGEDETKRLRFIKNAFDVPYIQSDMTFASYVEQVWSRLGGHNLYADRAKQENIQSVLSVVDSLAPYGNLNLKEFEQKIASLYAAPSSEKGAVQIMTMHSAKGLEFHEVILFGLHKTPPHERTNLLEIESNQGELLIGFVEEVATGFKDPVSELIKKRNKVRLTHEVDRLLYVACTRAKEKLHLMYLVNNGQTKPRAESMLARLVGHMREDLIEHSPVRESQASLISSVSSWQVEQLKQKRYTLETMEQLSQAHQVETIRFANHQGGSWSFENKLHSAIGTTCHYFLEQIGRDKLEGWEPDRIKDSESLIKRKLRHLGVNSEDVESASQRVIGLLSQVLQDEKGRYLLSSSGAIQEWSLFNEEEQHRIVDVVLDTPEGWLIVDYKTNQRFEEETEEVFKQRLIDLYKNQLLEYKSYLENLDGRPAKAVIYALEGCLWIEVF